MKTLLIMTALTGFLPSVVLAATFEVGESQAAHLKTLLGGAGLTMKSMSGTNSLAVTNVICRHIKLTGLHICTLQNENGDYLTLKDEQAAQLQGVMMAAGLQKDVFVTGVGVRAATLVCYQSQSTGFKDACVMTE